MRNLMSRALAVMLVLVLAVAASAQERERGGRGGFGGPGFGGGFGGINRLRLVTNEKVQEELGLVEEQAAKLAGLRDELRGDFPGFGRGGEGRRDPQDMTEEERREMMAEFRRQAAERATQEKEKLGVILMPHQSERLEEIYLQARGVGALTDETVAKEVGLTEDDLEELRQTMQEVGQQIREEMGEELRAAFQTRDQEAITAKMAEVQKKVEVEVLAVLSDEQKQKFAEMKGEKFDLPPELLQGRGFGRGRGGREGRPQRPQRPDGEV